MNILKHKKFQLGITATAIAALVVSSSVCFNNSSKANSNSKATVTQANEYSSKFRDTSIDVDSNGNIHIERTTHKSTSSKKDSWTLFIYLTGSDLESDYLNATKDIKEIFASSFNKEDLDKLNIIIQTGGSTDWHSNNIKSNAIGRYRVVGNKLTLLEEHPNASMGDSDTLYSFLNWGVKNYPAKHMGVIFWNHGSGVSNGLCVDTNYNCDSLSLNEVEYAFSKVNNKLTDSFELIGFDTCLSGSLEYANILAPYAKYMVASADLEPGDGWNYTPIVDYLVNNPDASGQEVGKVITDSYYEFYKQASTTEDYDDDVHKYTTMSVYDLSKVDNVCIEANYLAKYFSDKLRSNTSEFNKFSSLIGDCKVYEQLNVDLGSLIRALNSTNNFAYDTVNLKDALRDFIIYNNIGSEYSQKGCNGLTLYLPDPAPSLAELNMYRNAGFSPYWLNILEYITAYTKLDNFNKYQRNDWDFSEYFFEDNFGFLPYDNTTLNTNAA